MRRVLQIVVIAVTVKALIYSGAIFAAPPEADTAIGGAHGERLCGLLGRGTQDFLSKMTVADTSLPGYLITIDTALRSRESIVRFTIPDVEFRLCAAGESAQNADCLLRGTVVVYWDTTQAVPALIEIESSRQRRDGDRELEEIRRLLIDLLGEVPSAPPLSEPAVSLLEALRNCPFGPVQAQHIGARHIAIPSGPADSLISVWHVSLIGIPPLTTSGLGKVPDHMRNFISVTIDATTGEWIAAGN
jgi:hypothetical protein